MCRFLDAGNTEARRTLSRPGVQKGPGHEVAGSWATAGRRALWRFDTSAGYGGGREAGAQRPGRGVGGAWRRATGISVLAWSVSTDGRLADWRGCAERDRRQRGASATDGKAAALR